MKWTTAVLDVGKTNVRLCLADENLDLVEQRRRANRVLPAPPYPHADVEGLFDWVCGTLRELSSRHEIRAIVPVTHGAALALVAGNDLALPLLDYEWEEPGNPVDEANFDETGSPPLPAGLNLANQLSWQERHFPDEFSRAESLLLYPQYWAWRLSGERAAEVTSLGCHTHLWAPRERDYSALARERSWSDRFPALRPAWDVLGTITPEVVERTGLPADCTVHCGIHDSNAALLPHMRARASRPFNVVSTGTWVICMARSSEVRLEASLDMLYNVDVFSDPVACMRFPGGREYAAMTAGESRSPRREDIGVILREQAFAQPSFARPGGPFAHLEGRLEPDGTAANRKAIASLYCALMIDFCLERLEARGDVILEGPMASNPLLASSLAALRPTPLYTSDDATGSVGGAAMLSRWKETLPETSLSLVPPLDIDGLSTYRDEWRRRLCA